MKKIISALSLILLFGCATTSPQKADKELTIMGHDPVEATLSAVFQTKKGPVPGTLSVVEFDDDKGQKRVFALTSGMLFKEGDAIVDGDDIGEFVTGFRIVDRPGQQTSLLSSQPMVLNDVYQLKNEPTRAVVVFPVTSGKVHTLPFASKGAAGEDPFTLMLSGKAQTFIVEDSDIHAFGFEFPEYVDAYRGAAAVDADGAFVGAVFDVLRISTVQSVFVIHAEMIHDLLTLTLDPNANIEPYATQSEALTYERPARWISKSNESENIALERKSVSLMLYTFDATATPCERSQKELTSLLGGSDDEPNYSDTIPKGIGSRLLLGAERTFQRREKGEYAIEYALLCDDENKTESVYVLDGKKADLEAERETINSIRESFKRK